MRTPRALTVVVLAILVPTLAVAACGGGDDGLSAEEQRYADAFARDLADGDDGLAVDDEEGQCVGDAIMRELGTGPFKEAKVEPADLAGDESPGELLGKGAVSDDQAKVIAEEWNECVDLPDVFAHQASDQFVARRGRRRLLRGRAPRELGARRVPPRVVHERRRRRRPGGAEPDRGPRAAVLGRRAATGGVLVDAIAASLAEDGTLTSEEATCVAQHVVDEVGADKLVGIGGGESLADAPEDVQKDFATAIVNAAESCGLDLSKIG